MTINIDIYLICEDKHYKKGGKFASLLSFNGVEDAAVYAYKYIKQFKKEHGNKEVEIDKVIYEGTIDITYQVIYLYRKSHELYLIK